MASKILIIDDEVNTLEVLTSRLEANEYEVITAENGSEGLEKYKGDNPDLVILDVMMPVMDGFAFMKAVNADPDLGKTPVIVLTARGAMKDTFEAMSADAFMEKPYESDVLTATVARLLKKKALLFCDDPFVREKTTVNLKKQRYEVVRVEEEHEILKKAEEGGYRLIISHLPALSMSPEELAGKIRMLRPRPPRLIVYSDSRVKGTEDNSTSAIEALKVQWERAGADIFFDSRIARETLKGLLERVC